MGVESYLVRTSIKSSDLNAVISLAESQFGLVPDSDQSPLSGNDLYYVYRDGRHVIEFEFAQRGDAIQVSLRFALCNPESIDRIFIQQITKLLDHFDGTVTLCDKRGIPMTYTRESLDAFAVYCLSDIERERGYWCEMFGRTVAGISVSEALRTFVLPHCVPSAV